MAREYRVVAALADTPVPVAPRGDDAQRRLGARRAVPDGRVRAGPGGAPHRATRGARRQGHHRGLRRRADHGARRPARGGPATRWGSAISASPSGYLERQVRRWGSQWDLVKRDDDPCDARRQDAARQAGRRRFRRRVGPRSCTATTASTTRSSTPTTRRRCVAVLDWEMSTLGDPLSDAALMCVYRHPTFHLVHADAAWAAELIPDADELAEQVLAGRRPVAGPLGFLHGAGVLQARHHRRGHRLPGAGGRCRPTTPTRSAKLSRR